MKHPLFPVSGQEPVPCHPPVPSPPEFQSLGSPDTTEKETGTVFPMRARLGSMLDKGPGVGRIAVSVVRWVRAVPLGIKHDPRRVGGLCAPNRTSAPALPGTSEPAARSGVDGGSSVARALPQVRKPARVRLAAFLAVLDGRKTRRAEKIFFCKKIGIWQIWPLDGPKSEPIFFPVVPKFTPRKSDRKGARLNAGAQNFHDIWAFGGPDLVKNGQKSALRP